jgi:hypothetical protein
MRKYYSALRSTAVAGIHEASMNKSITRLGNGRNKIASPLSYYI